MGINHYVVVYCGYEGIEQILAVADSKEVAAKDVQRLRKRKTKDWNPDRLCVMTYSQEHKAYACCCAECGVSPSRAWLY